MTQRDLNDHCERRKEDRGLFVGGQERRCVERFASRSSLGIHLSVWSPSACFLFSTPPILLLHSPALAAGPGHSQLEKFRRLCTLREELRVRESGERPRGKGEGEGKGKAGRGGGRGSKLTEQRKGETDKEAVEAKQAVADERAGGRRDARQGCEVGDEDRGDAV